MPDRRTPLNLVSEKETLRDFLDYLRDSVVLKVAGLDDEVSRRPLVQSGTSLLGLIKHLTIVEIVWFQHSFAGLDVIVPSDDLDPDDRIHSVVSAYRAAHRRSNEIIDACDDIERLCARPLTTPEPLSLRWVLVHMVEETARHAGHADILREQIDGVTGR